MPDPTLWRKKIKGNQHYTQQKTRAISTEHATQAWLLEEDPTARFASFLAALGMARYLIRFADEEIHCIEDLAFLTVADLEDVGIPPADAPRLHARVAETAAMIS